MKFGEYIQNEAIKGWKNAQSDLNKWRKEKSQDAMDVVIVRLNKGGAESKMHDAKDHFKNEKEAMEKIEYWRKLNKGKEMNWNLYLKGKLKGKV